MHPTPQHPKTYRIVIAVILVILLVGLFPAKAGAASDQSSYIVQGRSTADVVRLVETHGGEVSASLEIIRGVSANLTQAQASQLAALAEIKSVTQNASVQLVASQAEIAAKKANVVTDYPDAVGADLAWEHAATGQGTTVAVVDTGISMSFPGLKHDTNGKAKNRFLDWVDFVDHSRAPRDPNGHGTHITGIIADSNIGDDGEWNGVAPGVSFVGVRVLDENGSGTYEHVIQGIQWVVEHKNEYNIRVMNLSLVSEVKSPYWSDPLNQAVMQAWANGITVVVAAGNSGPSPMTVGVPGNNPYVITVGAFTDNYTPYDWSDDYLAPFSAAGPTLDAFVKPDVLAPGAHIVSLMPANSVIARSHEASWVDNRYFAMAGTSQAAAVVSGISALVLSQHPGLTPDEVKHRLMVTSLPWIDVDTTEALYSMWQQGAGRVNAFDAVTGDITGAANLGLDITADINGTAHFEGYTTYDEAAGEFRLIGGYGAWSGGYGAWSGGYGAWSGGYGAWSGGYGAWSGGYDAWSGGYDAWSGGYGAWSGGYGAWSGGYGAWSGGYGAWSGGYGAWSGGYGAWSGSEPWAGSLCSDLAFVAYFLSGAAPDSTSQKTSINWVQEPGQ